VASFLLFAAGASAQDAEEKAPLRVSVNKAFAEAVRQLRVGEVNRAAELLNQAMDLAPSDAEAYLLRETYRVDTLFDFLKHPETKEAGSRLIQQAAQYAYSLRRDPATLREIIDRLSAEETAQRWKAMHDLAASGPFAVPYLLEVVTTDEVVPLAKDAAESTLLRIGRNGAAPLTEVLWHGDEKTLGYVLANLTGSLNRAAVPPLLALIEDPDRPGAVVDLARRALQEMETLLEEQLLTESTDTFSEACAALSRDYYYSDARLVKVIPQADRVIWFWNADAARLGDKLTFKDVPTYAFPRILSHEHAVAGLKSDPASLDLLEIYASNNYGFLDDALAAEDEARSEALQDVLPLNRSLGPRVVAASLDRALKDRNVPLARRCVDALRKLRDPRQAVAVPSLILATQFQDPLVRITAAETLIRSNPMGRLGGDAKRAQDVFGVLASGLGVQARPRIVIVTPDEGLAETAADMVGAYEGASLTREELPEALVELKGFLVQVEGLVLDARRNAEEACGLVAAIHGDAAMAKLPIVVISDETHREEILNACGADVVGVVVFTEDLAPLESAIKTALYRARAAGGKAEAAVRENQMLLERALRAFLAIPTGSAYFSAPDARSGLADAASRLIRNYPDDIRVLGLQLLRHLGQPGPRDDVFELFVSDQEPLEIRLEAGHTLLAILPKAPALSTPQRESLRALTASEQPEIAALAVSAYALADVAADERSDHLLAVDESIPALR
jgi:hypothetical protein